MLRCPNCQHVVEHPTTVQSRTRRQRLKAEGRCWQCGVELQGHTTIRCPRCMAIERQKARRRRTREAQEAVLCQK